MEQELEQKVLREEKKDEAISHQQAERFFEGLCTRRPDYGVLSEQEQKNIMKDLQRKPEIVSISEALPEAEIVSAKDFFTQTSRVLSSFQEGVSKVWTPENPSDYYTPEEQRRLQKERLKDKLFGRVLGNDHAAEYEARLLPVVRQRFKERVRGTIDETYKELDTWVNKLYQRRESLEKRIDDARQEILLNKVIITVSRERLEEIANEEEELKKNLKSAVKEGNKSATASFRKEKERLRRDQRIYQKGVSQAAGKIRAYATLIDQLYSARLMMQPFLKRGEDLVSNFLVLQEQFKIHGEELFNELKPSWLEKVEGVYHSSLKLVQALEQESYQAFQKMSEVKRKQAPPIQPLPYQKRPIPAHAERFVKEDHERVEEALKIAEGVLEDEKYCL